jgi:hypothetical protein
MFHVMLCWWQIIRKQLKSASTLLDRSKGPTRACLDLSGFDIIVPGGSRRNLGDGGVRKHGSVAKAIWQRLIMHSCSRVTECTNSSTVSVATERKMPQLLHLQVSMAGPRDRVATQAVTTTMSTHVRVKPLGLLEVGDIVRETGGLVYPQDYPECCSTLRKLGQELSLGNGFIDSAVVERDLTLLRKLLIGGTGASKTNDNASDLESEADAETASGSDSEFDTESENTEFVVMRRREFTEAFLPPLSGSGSDADASSLASLLLDLDLAVPPTFFLTAVALVLRTVDRGVILPGAQLTFLSLADYTALTQKHSKEIVVANAIADSSGTAAGGESVAHTVAGVVTWGKVSHCRGCSSIGLGYSPARQLHQYITDLRKWHAILTYGQNKAPSCPKFVLMCRNPRAKVARTVYFDVHTTSI